MFKKYNTEDVAKVEELILADKSIIELQHEADIINMTLESYGPLSKKYMNVKKKTEVGFIFSKLHFAPNFDQYNIYIGSTTGI